MSQLNVDTIKKADGTGNLSVPAETGTVVTTASPSLGRRNLIINGAMQVAQRGTSAVSVGNPTYLLDRWRGSKSGGGAFTMEQSTDAPDDFGYSLKIIVTTADSSVAASEFYTFQQRIEGHNTQQLNFGSSAAKTVALSFWVKSSVTGTFGGACANSAYNRSYPFTYTISSANTWEQKTVTLTGDTTGTWLTGNSVGLQLLFDLGSGIDNTGTAGAWVGAGNAGADGSTKLIETLNATFQITGVQLEVGSVATPFEHRSYGEELAACQRYYQQRSGTLLTFLADTAGANRHTPVFFTQSMRAAPQVTGSASSLTFFSQHIDTQSCDCGVTQPNSGSGSYTISGLVMDAEL